ncbi:MAG: retroviral-like aspartic protease family protein [Planctomycetes bacterium]|nr:retroviral-like aspartic protease family protein [Planctomycetota bacterium]
MSKVYSPLVKSESHSLLDMELSESSSEESWSYEEQRPRMHLNSPNQAPSSPWVTELSPDNLKESETKEALKPSSNLQNDPVSEATIRTQEPSHYDLAFDQAKQMKVKKEWSILSAWIRSQYFGPHEEKAAQLLRYGIMSHAKELIDEAHFEEAVHTLESHLHSVGGDDEVQAMIAQTYHQKGESLKAFRVLRNISQWNSEPKVKAKYMRRAQAVVDEQEEFLSTNGHWPMLLDFYDGLVKEDHERALQYQLSKSRVLLKLHYHEEAKELLDSLKYDFPDESAALLSTIQTDEEPSYDSEKIEIPIEIRGNSFYVQVLINDKVRLKLLVDTGASMIHLSSRALAHLGLSSYDIIEEKYFITAAGRVKSPVYSLQSVYLHGVSVKPIDAALFLPGHQGDMDGILGMNFLRHFNWSLDLSNRKMIFHKSNTSK